MGGTHRGVQSSHCQQELEGEEEERRKEGESERERGGTEREEGRKKKAEWLYCSWKSFTLECKQTNRTKFSA